MARSHVLRILIGAVVLAVLLVAGVNCTRVVNRTAERRIREALPDAIGPAREYRVHIENAPLQTVAGKFANVVIDGDEVRFPSGLLLDNLHIELKNVDIDTGKAKVRHIGDARFTITVSDKSLDQYLAGESPVGETIRHAQVSFADNSMVTVSGERVTLLNVGIPFRLAGPIRAASPTRVEIDPHHLTVVGIPIGGIVLDFLKGRIESAVDLKQFPVSVQLASVTTRQGSMTLSGSIDAEALLSRTEKAK